MPLIAILVIASLVRGYAIHREPLWIDEAYSWWDARQSFADLWSLAPQCDPHPALYFALLKGWMAMFGDSATALRALSACLGVATTAVVYFAGREIDRRVAWVAALLFALAPFQIYFSGEARPYALLCFGASLIVLGALRVARSDARPERYVAATAGWVALALGPLIALWSNNTSALLIASLLAGSGFIYCLTPERAERWPLRPAIIASLVVVLLWLPDAPVLLLQARGVSQDFWIRPPTFASLNEELHYAIGLDSVAAVWPMVAVMAGGLALLIKLGRWREAAIVGSLAVLPVALNVAVSAAIQPILVARTLIGATPAFMIALAAAVCLIADRRLRATALVLLVGAYAFAAFGLLDSTHLKEPWDVLSAKLLNDIRDARPGALADVLVLVVPNELALPLSHALKQRHATLPVRGIPGDFPAPGMTARYPSGKCAPSLVGQDLASVGAAMHGKKAVYFITRRNNVYDPVNSVAAYLRAQGWTQTATDEFDPGALQIQRFVASP